MKKKRNLNCISFVVVVAFSFRQQNEKQERLRYALSRLASI